MTWHQSAHSIRSKTWTLCWTHSKYKLFKFQKLAVIHCIIEIVRVFLKSSHATFEDTIHINTRELLGYNTLIP
jgi:hypothetical protein